MQPWMSYADAATLLGHSRHLVARFVREGRLEQRKAPRKLPSISAESVHRLAVELAQERESAAEAERLLQEQKALRGRPPQDGQVWLNARELALLLDISVGRVSQRVRAGRIPYTEHGGQRWFRRVDAEILAAAKAFKSRKIG